MKRLRTTARRAVTLTELLVVLVIISLLASIAVPTYIQKIAQARVTIARVETKEIAEALQSCAIVHGFVVPLRALDNIANDPSSSDPADDFSDTTFLGARLIDAYQPVQDQITNGQPITVGDSDSRATALRNFWQGPFIEYHRFYTPSGTSNLTALSDADLARDFPLDPWGKPYRLYAPTGLVGSTVVPTTAGAVYSDPMDNGVDDGVLTNFESSRFDRWAVLSTGPSGFSDGTATNPVTVDDIYYTFNVTIENETAYSLF